ncbi:MAG TPA: hypothetical protein VJR05_04080 [Acidimicrobiia bacterium]|nr:hypothetical protein [Acidimicrobiia bacterium]
MSGRHLQPPPSSEPGERPDLAGRAAWVLGALLIFGLILVGVTVFGGGGGTTTTTMATSTTLVAGPTTTGPTTTISASTTTTTTAVSTTTTEAASTTTTDPLASLVLAEQSLGPLNFGTDAEDTISGLTSILGPPDEDTGWVDSFSAFGTCPGTEARLVRWVSLQAFFTNGATDWAPEGTRHFFHYSQSAAAGGGEIHTLTTDRQIGLGSTIADLETAYGSQLTVTDDPLFDTLWEVEPAGPGLLWGSASASTPDGVVTAINGGFGCGE